MKRIATLSLVVSLFATAAFALDGAWTASMRDDRDHINFNFTTGNFNNNGMTLTVAAFTSLTPSQIYATTMTPVNFEMRREAGTISYEGTFRNGKGAGQFTFAPDRTYIDKVRALGLTFELSERRRHREGHTEDDDLFTCAVHDVSTAYIRSMQAIGYKTSFAKYLTMRIFNITPEYVREMESLGFKLDEDEIVTSKIHGVTPKYVREMRAAGFTKQDFDDFVAFRIHGVTQDFIRELHELGYDNVSADDLVAMRIHGVTPQFIRDLRGAGYDHVPVHKMVEMRIHGVDARYMKAMN
jgi:hypothetical protein